MIEKPDTISSHSEVETITKFHAVEHFRPEVIQLAEHLERLPPGDYLIKVEKPDLKGLPWRMEIAKTERITIVDLMR